MLAALRVIFQALNDVRLKGYTYIWANVAFAVLCVPIFTAPAAYSALCRVAHAARQQPWEADLELFWATFRANLWRALPWGLAHGAFAVVNFTNLTVYAVQPALFWQALRVVWIGMTLIWLGVLLYTWFLYYEMEQPTLWGATRNALVMVLLNPLFTLVLIIGIILLGLVSIMLPALGVLLSWGVAASVGAGAVLNRLSLIRQSHHPEVE